MMRADRYPKPLPLKWAANEFLQVLVERFTLWRQDNANGMGVQLSLRIDSDTEAIWLRDHKTRVRARCRDFERRARQQQALLDEFLIDGVGDRCAFGDGARFPFRYASGGTLPIIRMAGRDYYCLFYREIEPIGWNIANGGSDDLEELRDPSKTIRRELREELLVIDPHKKRRYVFDSEVTDLLELPEFVQARRMWRQILGSDDFMGWDVLGVPVKWLDGPDSVRIKVGREPARMTKGYFLNINALDFGIEVDKVARIHLSEDVVLCDGEVLGDRLVNAPVGLFEVRRFNAEFQARCDKGTLATAAFRPDFFFYNGSRYEGDELEEVIHNEFLPDLWGADSGDNWRAYRKSRQKLGLCPVTERIVRRYLQLYGTTDAVPAPAKSRKAWKVFISHAGEDIALAEAVSNFVSKKARGGVFFSKHTITDSNFSRAIDDALDAARCLIVVGSRPEHLVKGWVEYEWRSFHNDMNSGRKPNGILVPFVQKGLDLDALPRPLRDRQAVEYPTGHLESGLADLSRWITA